MTGITAREERLGRLVSLAMTKGVPSEAFGLGGARTVGPLVTLQVEGGRPVYRTNGRPGVTLGRTFAEAKATILREYRAFVETPAIPEAPMRETERAVAEMREDADA